MRLLFAVALLPLLACRTWGRPEEYKWEIVLFTPKVSRGGDFSFQVETKGSDGLPIKGFSYVYVIDWTSVKGSRHKGVTYEVQSLRCKGDPGTGQVRIYTKNESDTLVEVARASFTVE